MDIDITKTCDLLQKIISIIDEPADRLYIYEYEGQYIITVDYKLDNSILKLTGLTNEEYIEMGVKAGGEDTGLGIIFNNIEQAEEFKEWLESMAVMNKLRGNQ